MKRFTEALTNLTCPRSHSVLSSPSALPSLCHWRHQSNASQTFTVYVTVLAHWNVRLKFQNRQRVNSSTSPELLRNDTISTWTFKVHESNVWIQGRCILARGQNVATEAALSLVHRSKFNQMCFLPPPMISCALVEPLILVALNFGVQVH